MRIPLIAVLAGLSLLAVRRAQDDRLVSHDSFTSIDTVFTFQDDNLATWSDTLIFDTSLPPGASYTVGQDAAVGLEAPSRSVRHNFCADGDAAMAVAHWGGPEFDPAGRPDIYVGFDFDVRSTGVAVYPLIKQGAKTYAGPRLIVGGNTWARYARTSLTESDFGPFDDPASANPNFNRPMRFGYVTANSTQGTGCPSSILWVDNFRVDVTTGPTENLPPIANVDHIVVETEEDEFSSTAPVFNDIDPNGDSLWVTTVSLASWGDTGLFQVPNQIHQSASYSWLGGGPGYDGFTYTLTDGVFEVTGRIEVLIDCGCQIFNCGSGLGKGSSLDTLDLELIRRFRDELMKPSEHGSRLVERYYETTVEILWILLRVSPGLRDRSVNMVAMLQPSLRNVLDGDGSLPIAQAQMDTVEAFFTDLAAVGTDSLKQIISDELGRLGSLDDYVGLPVADVLETVLGEQIGVGAEAQRPAVPSDFVLEQNFPNPFSRWTEIRFALPRPTSVEVAVYDIEGRRVKSLLSGDLSSGLQKVVWTGTDNAGRRVSSGVYLVRLETASLIQTKTVVLQR